MRDTDYAKELGTSRIDLGNGHELRIERLFIKDREREEIRFSWWKDDKMIPRPPDGTVEGKVYCVNIDELYSLNLAESFEERLPMFLDENYNEGFGIVNGTESSTLVLKYYINRLVI